MSGSVFTDVCIFNHGATKFAMVQMLGIPRAGEIIETRSGTFFQVDAVYHQQQVAGSFFNVVLYVSPSTSQFPKFDYGSMKNLSNVDYGADVDSI